MTPRTRRFLAVLIGAVLGLAAVAWATSRRTTDPEQLLAEFLRAERLAGGVLALGPAGQPPRMIAAGTLEAGARRPVASLSKPVTAAAILLLVEQGRLGLDDRLAAVFPEVAAAPDARHGAITIRHLLQHTAGWDRLASFDPIIDPARLGLGDATSCAPVARAMLDRPLQFDPGARYAYSNLGYCWLGLVIAERAGRDQADAVREAVLAPAGAGGMRMEGEAPFPQRPGVLGAAGGWFATAEEYHRFASRPLPPGTTEAPVPVSAGRGYGLGWGVWAEAGLVAHFGALPGMFAVVVRTREGGVAVALFDGRPRDDERAYRRLREALAALPALRAAP
jgi:N-acyl-D-amino-acid deacylase